MTVRESSPSHRPPALEAGAALEAPARVKWGVLCYLAGDLGPHSEPIARDLQEILSAGAGPGLAIALQYDGPEGATRYLLSSAGGPAADSGETETLGRIDSGSSNVLADFMRWALSSLDAERVALLIGGHSLIDPYSDAEPPRSMFTICRDDSAGSQLDTIELGTVVREVLREFERDQIELLAGDLGHMQFLELAYELEGRVQVLLSSQTQVPAEGWNYTRLFETWKRALAAPDSDLNTETLVRLLVPEMLEAYRQSDDPNEFALSALDLRQLDEISRAFDTLCVNTMQALGEGLIWRARSLLVERFGDAKSERRRHTSYDCGSFFVLFSVVLDTLQSQATQSWIAVSLKRSGSRALQRFQKALGRELQRSSIDPQTRTDWLHALAVPDPTALVDALLTQMDAAVRGQLDALAAGHYDPGALARAQALDQQFAAVLRRASGSLSEERRLDYDRLEQSALAAARLANQARQTARMLLGPAAPDFVLHDAAALRQSNPLLTEADGVAAPEGMVIASGSTRPSAQVGWPRWSGASLYRPPKLDDLMVSSYQRFRFHERVHWAALLGTANLIDDHPRALWRLVSSLLSTGGAGTRRDLLRRFTGADSVVWGLRDQFRVMAPAPLVTLSLERRRRMRVSSVPPASEEAPQRREDYVLRLDSAARGAVVTEQQSRVQPKTMDRALRALEELLQTETSTNAASSQLRSVGGLLGEDVLQALSLALETERQAALSDGAGSVHLQLQIPRELMAYPWELMHHRGEWLSEKFAIGRQVFMATGLARRVPRRREGRVRALVIGDPKLDPQLEYPQLPAARSEAHQVAGVFDRLRRELGEVIDFDPARDALIGTTVSCADLRARLRDDNYDIVHFAGHGRFKPDDPEASAWLLSDGELWALEIRNTLLDHPAPPWLVYANACEAAQESKRRYQGNVFGLASAFINQGVAAYIAPLWPIEDLMAQQIALQFYRQLLSERRTLGESLRRAKAMARQIALPSAARPGEALEFTSLGWASLVLYGDPTEELFQALAGKEADPKPQAAAVLAAVPQPTAALEPASVPCPLPLHAPDHLLQVWAGEPAPTRRRRAVAKRGADPDAAGPQLELVEEAGLRRFRIRNPAAARASLVPSDPSSARRGEASAAYEDLPGSNLGQLLADERVRRNLPARRGIARVIGRWMLRGFDGGLNGLVQEYDRDEVPEERLLAIDADALRPLQGLRQASEWDAGDRALLLIHGTFSKTANPVEGLGPAFFEWARKRYRAVLGFDHWTLSKHPLENAELLIAQLRALAPQLLQPGRLDVITHSRGGLVARAAAELLDAGDAMRNLIFIGTPNCGTDLANPKNWGALANTLINLTGLDRAELFGKLAGLLARLAVLRGEQSIPGLLAQNPLSAGDDGSFLSKLQRVAAARSRTRYGVITAEFEPSALVPDLKALWTAAASIGLDSAADALFGKPHDLVVNTAHVWCVDQPPSACAALPACLEPERVLAFVGPDSQFALPERVLKQTAVGVHHNNLFCHTRSQEVLRRWLQEAPGFIG